MRQSYYKEINTYTFRLAVGAGGEFPPAAAQPPSAQEVLEQSPHARNVVMVVSLFDNTDNYVRIAPPAPPAQVRVPYIIVGFNQGPVGGEVAVGPVSGVGQGTRYAYILTPDHPHLFFVPPNARMFANVRGTTVPDPPAPPAPFVNTVRLSVLSTSSVEPAADGQTKIIVDGVRAALREVVPDAILAAAKLLGFSRRG